MDDTAEAEISRLVVAGVGRSLNMLNLILPIIQLHCCLVSNQGKWATALGPQTLRGPTDPRSAVCQVVGKKIINVFILFGNMDH